jgi:hypothetical protein
MKEVEEQIEIVQVGNPCRSSSRADSRARPRTRPTLSSGSLETFVLLSVTFLPVESRCLPPLSATLPRMSAPNTPEMN